MSKSDNYKQVIRRLLIGMKSLKASLTRITLWQKMDAATRSALEKTIVDAEDLLVRRGTRKQKKGITDPVKKKGKQNVEKA